MVNLVDSAHDFWLTAGRYTDQFENALPSFLDVNMLEEAYSDRTKAVMLTHTLGNPFDISAVKSFCNRYGLWLINDNFLARIYPKLNYLAGEMRELLTVPGKKDKLSICGKHTMKVFW